MKRIFVCSFLVGMGLFLSACPKPVCGDGVVDAELGEACDDGNNIDADGCEADCSLPACENGIQDPGEICFVAKTFDTGAGDAPEGITLGDFNEDGLLDIAVGNVDSDDVGIFLNLGEEQFSIPALFSLQGLDPTAIATADFNGDAHLDLVVANGSTNDVEILLGDGEGAFLLSGGVFPVGDTPFTLAVGDIDGLNGPDLVVGNKNSSNLTILFQDGAGGFVESPSSPLPAGGEPIDLVLEDFDAAFLDIVVVNDNLGPVNFFFGQSNGETNATPFLITDQRVPTGVAAGDINGDGNQDLVVSRSDAVTPEFVLDVFINNNGNASFELATSLFLNDLVLGTLAFPELADLDQDGRLDIVALDGASVFVLLGEANAGLFSVPQVFEAPGNTFLAVGDLNGDTLLDLAITDFGGDEVVVLFSAP